MKTKGFTFPQELILGLASGEITMVCLPVKQLAGFQDAKSVHPDGSGNGWIAWSGNTSAKETKRLYPGKQGFMPPLTVGDTLAVKETFRYAFDYIIFDCLQYKIDKHCKKPKNLDEKTGYIFEENCNNSDGKWKSPITMPLWACRIHRPVTGVKVARIQDVTEEDAIAMGVKPLFNPEDVKRRPALGLDPMPYQNYLWHGHFGIYGRGNHKSDAWEHQYSSCATAKMSLSSRHELTHGKGSWDSNDYFWIYTLGEPVEAK